MTAGDDRLIFLVFTAQQQLRNYLKRRLAGEGVRITAAQAAILFLLGGSNGQTMSELSQALVVDNSTLTGMVDRLERMGFATRAAHPGDRRAYRIEVSQEGLAEARKAKKVLQEVNEEIRRDFSPEDVESFKRVLRAFFHKFH